MLHSCVESYVVYLCFIYDPIYIYIFVCIVMLYESSDIIYNYYVVENGKANSGVSNF